MKINVMKVTDVETLGRIAPSGGSGTGYSEYVKFRVHFEDETYRDVVISDWYNHDQWTQFKEELSWSNTCIIIDNWNDVYDMFMTALRHSQINN